MRPGTSLRGNRPEPEREHSVEVNYRSHDLGSVAEYFNQIKCKFLLGMHWIFRLA